MSNVPVTWSEATLGPQFAIQFQDQPNWGHLLATGYLVWLDCTLSLFSKISSDLVP